MYVRVHGCSKQCRACNYPRRYQPPFLRAPLHPAPPPRLSYYPSDVSFSLPYHPLRALSPQPLPRSTLRLPLPSHTLDIFTVSNVPQDHPPPFVSLVIVIFVSASRVPFLAPPLSLGLSPCCYLSLLYFSLFLYFFVLLYFSLLLYCPLLLSFSLLNLSIHLSLSLSIFLYLYFSLPFPISLSFSIYLSMPFHLHLPFSQAVTVASHFHPRSPLVVRAPVSPPPPPSRPLGCENAEPASKRMR